MAKHNSRSLILDPRSPIPTRRGGFTLIEIMVVVVIIVLMIGMALPVFHALTGNRSEEGARNLIAAALGRARADALGLQQPYGIAIMSNASTGKTSLAEVYFAPTIPLVPGVSSATVVPGGYFTNLPSGQQYNNYYLNNTNTTQTYTSLNATGYVNVYGPALEIVPDTDLVSLPAGVGAQTICNCSYSGSNRSSNGYLSVGVVLFDGHGRLTSLPYGISQYSKLGNAALLTTNYPTVSTVGMINQSNVMVAQGVYSQFGLVVYQNDAFQSQRSSQQPEALYTDASTYGSQNLPDYTAGSKTQQSADSWLDTNATPLLLDRYTGTLIKAE